MIRLFFFLFVFFSQSSVFAGEKYGYGGVSNPQSAMDKCSKSTAFPVDWWAGVCTPSGVICPSDQNGGGCQEMVSRSYYPYGNTQGTPQSFGFSSTYTYCPDTAPVFDGTKCVKDDNPCKSLKDTFDNGGSPSIVQLPGPSAVYTGKAVGGKVPSSICVNQCAADPRAGYEFSAGVGKDGNYTMQGNPKYTGETCGGVQDESTSHPKNTPEYDCLKSGRSYGYVNGSLLCTTPIDPTENKSTGKSDTTTKSNADGTKTETKVSTNVSCTGDGSCVTTTTTTTTVINSDGSRGAPTTTTDTKITNAPPGSEPKLDKTDPFCVSNPTSPICKNGKFSGSCDSPPSCDGDPVQCASAVAVFKLECKQPVLGDISTISNGGVGDDIGQRKLDTNSISYTSLGSSAGCPSPKSVSVMGRTVSLDYSSFCAFSSGIRAIVLLMAWVAAGYIVFGVGGKNA